MVNVKDYPAGLEPPHGLEIGEKLLWNTTKPATSFSFHDHKYTIANKLKYIGVFTEENVVCAVLIICNFCSDTFSGTDCTPR